MKKSLGINLSPLAVLVGNYNEKYLEDISLMHNQTGYHKNFMKLEDYLSFPIRPVYLYGKNNQNIPAPFL